MKVIKSRTEIALIRLLERCQEIAKNSEDIASEWRLPEFVASCEQMLTSLPKPPDSCATSPDSVLEYQNKIKFLKSLLPPPEEEKYEADQKPVQQIVPMPLPQGSSLARDTVSKQIYQKMAERQNMTSRDQLLGQTSNKETEGVKGGMTLDKLLSDQREQQERIAEEMLMLTKSLKEQSSIAGNIIRSDTAKLESTSALADSNLEKLDVETKRVGEFSARGNCRCWIWLMMVVVVFTFIGMVLMMRLFSKKIHVPTAAPPVETVSKSHTHIMDEVWQPDEFLAEFNSDTFDVETHATEILRTGNINEEVQKLTTALSSVDTCIQQHVSDHYSDLLSRAVASSELETSLGVMATHISSLQTSTDRLRARVKDPFDKIKAGTNSLSRLQETTDILRRVIRILQLSKKLGASMGSEPDLTKAASCLAEMSCLLQEDLTGLEVVEGEARKVRQWRAEVERQAEGLMTRGMATGNQTHLATGLQVFYNLGTLSGVLDGMMEDLRRKLKTQWTESLDIKRITESSEAGLKVGRGAGPGPGKAALPVAGNNAAFRSSLWANIDASLEAVHSLMSQLWLLQRLLTKKIDPVTHQPFITILQSPNIVLNSWVKICKIIKDCLFNAQTKSNFVKQTFEGEYPKLVKLYEELWNKLKYTSNQFILSSVHLEIENNTEVIDQVIFKDDMEEGLRESLAQFEHAYLARSLSRLFDPINLMFGAGAGGAAGLSVEEVTSLVTVIASELSIASVDARLLTSVTRNIGKAISLFCVKCEGCVDSEASQVIGQPSAAQLQNISIVNMMWVLSEKLGALCSDQEAVLGAGRIEILDLASRDVSKLMTTAVEPLLASVNDSIEAILLTMHKEDFSSSEGDSSTPAAACSLYMKELQSFLERIARDFFATFTCREFLFIHLHALAEKTIQRFVMQGSLVRPLGSCGAMRLASDCAQLEFALSNILGPSGQSAIGPTGLTALGTSYRLLRAFRALLFLTPEDMATFPGLGSTVPHSTCLHLLFSRCPAVLPSPAASLGWSLARYTAWLEDHEDERERLLLVQGAIEAYVAAARARQDKSFVPQYPVLVDVLQRGLSMV